MSCPECGVQVTQLRRHLKKVHPERQEAAPVTKRKRGDRPAEARSGELWARCPECHAPVKDAELFTHLLNCPGGEVRQAEWVAQQAAAAAKAAEAKAADAKAAEAKAADAVSSDVQP